ncbi:MAG: hypothetical protein NZ518_04125, partial [Dehalococcoidia bacterium]|nr:hypothetical protein [Dehalococcoidia bacterium]
VVDPAMFHSYADYSLYDGQSLTGWPTLTMARGQVVMRDGAIVGTPGHGRYLARVATRRS